MARVLLIEDDEEARRSLFDHLRVAGHEVTTANRADEGIRLATDMRPDLVIVDRQVAGEDGTTVCRALRWEPRTRATPVMVLSSSPDPIDRIVTFELGAQDYVLKPFSVREVVLRARAILRRSAAATREPSASELHGALRVDRVAHRIWSNDREVHVSRRELRLLLHLIDARGQVQGRAQLVDTIWGKDDLDAASRALDTAIKRLRRKLGETGRYVRTVRGVGYRFAIEGADD